jgi:hypothetical protein
MIMYRSAGYDSRLPRWFPYLVLPLGFNNHEPRYWRRLAAWRRRCRVIGKCQNRHALLVTYPQLAWLGRFLIWWAYHRWWLEEQLIKLGILRSPVEADYFENYRFDPPDLWGTPLRRHEAHLR